MACFTLQDIGGCGCAACTQTFTVKCCNGAGYQGVTVSLYTASGGTLLTSGTTNSSGVVALTWSGTASPWVTVTPITPRFVAYGQTMSLTCGGSTTIVLTVATGYTCIAGCCLPVATTLFLTTSSGATATLTYNALTTQWAGTGTYAYPGCAAAGCGCAAASIPVRWNWAGTTSGTIILGGWIAGINPCPITVTTGNTQQFAGRSGFSVAIACPPTFSVTTLIPLGDTDSGCFYCGGAGESVTITE